MIETFTIQAFSAEHAKDLVTSQLKEEGNTNISVLELSQLRSRYFQLKVSYEKKRESLIDLEERQRKTSEMIQKIARLSKMQEESMRTLQEMQLHCSHPFVVQLGNSNSCQYCICCHKYIDSFQCDQTVLPISSSYFANEESMESMAQLLWDMYVKERKQNEQITDLELASKMKRSLAKANGRRKNEKKA